jgi:hypothetical protein
MSRLRSAIFSPATARSVARAGWPSTMSEMSVLVPPMSNGMKLPSFMSAEQNTPPATPPAGPDRTAPAAMRTDSATGTTPPCDCMMSSGPA